MCSAIFPTITIGLVVFLAISIGFYLNHINFLVSRKELNILNKFKTAVVETNNMESTHKPEVKFITVYMINGETFTFSMEEPIPLTGLSVSEKVSLMLKYGYTHEFVNGNKSFFGPGNIRKIEVSLKEEA